MAYPGVVLLLLISTPSDITNADRSVVYDTVNRWNVGYGESLASAFLPMHWGADAAAHYGVRPQDAINEQLVDRSDVVLAIFWHRFGSPTGVADSGTVEELERAVEAGKYVAVLRCTRDVGLEL